MSKLMTIKEVAAFTGNHVQTVRYWINRGKVKTIIKDFKYYLDYEINKLFLEQQKTKKEEAKND